MKLKIEFNMDNAAFGDWPEAEASRILKELAEKVLDGRGDGPIRDINGSTVGELSVTD